MTTNPMTTVGTVILAGGKTDPAMRAATGVDNRALAELTPGKTMLDYVLEAVCAAPSVGEVIVVGDVPPSKRYRRLAPGTTFPDNLLRGVRALQGESERVLIVTSDIPFITSAGIEDFTRRALETNAQFCYPIISMQAYNREFSGLKRTTLKLAEGEFTGGNAIVMSVPYLLQHPDTIQAAYGARKDVARLGAMLGWDLLARLVLSQTLFPKMLDIAAIERGVGRLLGHGATARAVITDHPALGTDIDHPEDIAIAREMLSRREEAPQPQIPGA